MEWVLIKLGLRLLLCCLALYHFYQLQKVKNSKDICLCIYYATLYVASIMFVLLS